MTFFESLIDIILPRYCVLCHRRGNDLCKPCLSKFKLCSRELPASVHAHFDYRDPSVRAAIRSMKYRNRFRITEEFGMYLYEDILLLSNELLKHDHEKILIIAIPSHKSKIRNRGFNQSELLARRIGALAQNEDIHYIRGALTKVRTTLPQAQTKSKKERLTNLKGAFLVHQPALVRGALVIVVDDVITTGATYHEAVRALKAAGAKKVFTVAVAH